MELDMISNLSGNTRQTHYKKKKKKKKQLPFYYIESYERKSRIFTTTRKRHKGFFSLLFYDSLIPFSLVLSIHSLIWVMHQRLDNYCYVKDLCDC